MAGILFLMSENKNRERGEKRALADTEDAAKAANDDEEN